MPRRRAKSWPLTQRRGQGWLPTCAKLDTVNAHIVGDPPLLLLFDGDCGICTATAHWLERRVAPDQLRPLALTLAGDDPRTSDAVLGRDLAATLQVVRPDGSVVTGAAAVLAAGRLVPRWGTVARLADHRLGRALLEPLYRAVARNRHRIGRALGLPSTCAVPGRSAGPG